MCLAWGKRIDLLTCLLLSQCRVAGEQGCQPHAADPQASIAEEVKNPGKVIPQAMLLSLVVITVTYLAVIVVV
ncbi:MAG TPA: APC family permease, partial [Planctomycetaceae bacterium]|nr:APC family permease [Planctomycetaceae bacterium]